MAGTLNLHLGAEIVERYAMGKVSSGAAAEIEEHLLICGKCRRSVAAADAYVKAMRLAAAKVRDAGRKLKRKSGVRPA